MKLHANARLSVKGRELLVDRTFRRGWSSAQAAEAAGVSERTACKWLARFPSEGEQGLLDRPSTPKSSPSRTPDQRVQVIAAPRRLRMTGAEIAECLDMAVTTVSGILTRIGMGKLGRLGWEPAQRYERERPGELAAFGLTARGMSCSEAVAAVKTVKVEGQGYASPPGYECASKPALRGVEETTCASGEHSFSWFLREP